MRLVDRPADFHGLGDVFIFGAGDGGLTVYRVLRKLPGVRILGFIDNNKRGELRGLPIIGLDDFLGRKGDPARIVIASMYAFEIAAQLRRNGIVNFDNALPLINARSERLAERGRRIRALITIFVLFGSLIWMLA